MLAGAAGRDFNFYGEDLTKTGVDISGVVIDEEVFTASFFANTDADNNQIASFYPGAMSLAADIRLEALCDDDSLVIISPNDPAAMSHHADECRRLNIPFIYDPGQQIARLNGKTLKNDSKGASILIMNEYEAGMFKKQTELNDQQLFDLAEVVIVTLGKKGAEIRTREKTHSIPAARELRIMDPTGVGDAFRAGLMTGIELGADWDTAGKMGSLAAAYVLETDGPQNHSYTIGEFIRRYKENFGDNRFVESLRSRHEAHM